MLIVVLVEVGDYYVGVVVCCVYECLCWYIGFMYCDCVMDGDVCMVCELIVCGVVLDSVV